MKGKYSTGKETEIWERKRKMKKKYLHQHKQCRSKKR